MSKITYQVLEEAYMRHVVTGDDEPDTLYVSYRDFRSINALFTEEQIRAGRALRFNAALMYDSLTAPDGEMHVYRHGQWLGVESIYSTVV